VIPTLELQAIRSRTSILNVIGERVQLRQEGHEYVGCCPFHEEKTPSFKVDPKKNGGVYICFGCGEKGDVFRFIQRSEGLSFGQAVERAKELSGITDQPNAAPPNSRRKFQQAGPQLLPPRQSPPKIGPITAVYPYVDEHGATLFEVCRHEPGENGKAKDFRQRVPTGNGFTYSVKGIRRVLYRLPAVLAASEVWICEGEKDVHTLEAQGVTATTNAGGAKSPWLPEYSEALRGKDVLIVP
jgi:DNA primase